MLALITEIVMVGLILSADSFSAALAMGHWPYTRKNAFSFAISSGGAEGLATLVAALAGDQIIKHFGEYDHWIAFILLMLVALHMLHEGIMDLIKKDQKNDKLEFHSFFKILIVSFATSLDALGVGIGLGVAGKPIIPFVISITIWAMLATLLGLYLAKKLSAKFGAYTNIFGSIVLILIAWQMLKI